MSSLIGHDSSQQPGAHSRSSRTITQPSQQSQPQQSQQQNAIHFLRQHQTPRRRHRPGRRSARASFVGVNSPMPVYSCEETIADFGDGIPEFGSVDDVEGYGIAASHSDAYMVGLFVVPRRMQRSPSLDGSRCPIGAAMCGATASKGAANSTHVVYFHPDPRCVSSHATGLRSAGGSKSVLRMSTWLMRSMR